MLKRPGPKVASAGLFVADIRATSRHAVMLSLRPLIQAKPGGQAFESPSIGLGSPTSYLLKELDTQGTLSQLP